MNYIDCIKQQIILYIVTVLAGFSTYFLMCYFKGLKPLIITPYYMGVFVGGTFSHFFIFPLLVRWFNSLKK